MSERTDPVPYTLTATEQAALPHVTVATFAEDPILVYPRRTLDRLSEGAEGYQFGCRSCGKARFENVYDSAHGVLMMKCTACHHVIGAVRVAADA